MDIELIPCSPANLEHLLAGPDVFLTNYGLQVAEDYLPFEGALEHSLQQIQSQAIWHPWLPYLFIWRPDRTLVGMGGFKAIPDSQRTVEIGYSVAPAYQGKGIATAAAQQLIVLAFSSGLVDCVCAHTLAEPSASTSVLQKCGMVQISEVTDPDDGPVWRWEIHRCMP
ncbi:GNAT family N-acetyltransferase [Leptolyngbya sp. 'hensonii']|uniref:GNAT family N-acetyltransferase n=1 Tax=Leptolyngbya sp. 'hensonii' TaxID=1922337 RepID=UPI00094FB098|nr:GNAT family N-acetyltransferase [Leptolyngbya sp. 'hensonii']OLP19116.1 GNAT family N-acetyltransferase [Leptolyngbya sp. 'hensonii']